MLTYSERFRKLIDSQEQIIKLLYGCHFNSDNFPLWEQNRWFISKAINQDGTILDIGCANGFLLKCLQEWTSYRLVPFGVDTDKELIKQAKDLFSDLQNNFAELGIEEIE